MISEKVLEATPRTRLGKGGARQLRREGRIPITLYGGEEEGAVSLSIERQHLLKILLGDAGANTIFQLKWNGESTTVILKNWQVDPQRGSLLHADLLRISMTKITRVRVPVELIGEPIGMKSEGGVLDFATHYLEVECMPADIPDRVRIDVTGLRLGDHVSVKDLKLGDDVRILEEPDRVIASLFAPRVEAEAAPVVTEPLVTEEEVATEEKEGGAE